ncbi:hypothetical protein [Litorihabitans aurantiacus]|uniref:Polyketide cyclase / dehydrase and lipid transport n=1 Tax=Litorihabitans aurantiacus TaxID=1930061 RepID=A0AA37XGH7_9MICO|nr:hypothetical protein [Litorihabitans aurantiacus]GMA32955.1 hypothetical protein GCM10025875_29470 [Litorihabitans aurantiacus]
MRGPLGLRAEVVVTAVDESTRTWSWTARSGPVELDLAHGVGPAGDGGARTWLRIRGPRPLVLAYAVPARLALRRLVRLPVTAAEESTERSDPAD